MAGPYSYIAAKSLRLFYHPCFGLLVLFRAKVNALRLRLGIILHLQHEIHNPAVLDDNDLLGCAKVL